MRARGATVSPLRIRIRVDPFVRRQERRPAGQSRKKGGEPPQEAPSSGKRPAWKTLLDIGLMLLLLLLAARLRTNWDDLFITGDWPYWLPRHDSVGFGVDHPPMCG